MPGANHLFFFRDLSGEGVFEIISDVLQSQDRKIVSAGYLLKIVFIVPSILVNHILFKPLTAVY